MVYLIEIQHEEVLLLLDQNLKQFKYFLKKNVNLVISGRTAAGCAPFRHLEEDVPIDVPVGRTCVMSCMAAQTASTNFWIRFTKLTKYPLICNYRICKKWFRCVIARAPCIVCHLFNTCSVLSYSTD